MQVQMNPIAPPANTAHGGKAGSDTAAGDASFSQLLDQAAAPREPAPDVPTAPTPRADRGPATDAATQGEHGDASQAQACALPGDAREPLPCELVPALAAPTDNPIEVAPAIAPADPALVAWLAAFTATVVTPTGTPSTQGGREPIDDALAARPGQPSVADRQPGTRLLAEAVAIHPKPADSSPKSSPLDDARRPAHDASRGIELAAVPQPLRTARAIELQQAPLVDPNQSAIASITPTGAQAAHPAAPVATAAPAAQLSTLQLPQPVGSAEFAPSLALTLTRLARDGVQEARLQLHPTEMGPIDVRIAVEGTQARVDFSADVLATRAAIEGGLPQLASALREAGLTLAGGSVYQHAHGKHEQRAGDAPRSERSADDPDAVLTAAAPRRSLMGVVDLYA